MPRTLTLTAKQFLQIYMDQSSDIPSAVMSWCEAAKLGRKVINRASKLPMHAKECPGIFDGYSADDIRFLCDVFDCPRRQLPRLLFSDNWST